jgi:glycosyltransferase involved in cell wall biosynthesis
MDVFAPSLRQRAVRAFREEGVGGIVRRAGPFLARVGSTARARLWRRYRPPVTAIALVGEDVNVSELAERLLQNRSRAWRRWLSELIVISRGGIAPDDPPGFVKGVPVRHYHLGGDNDAIVLNAAIALALGAGVCFLDSDSPPLTSAFLSIASTAFRRGVDAILRCDERPPFPESGGVHGDTDFAGVESFLREEHPLVRLALRRHPFINAGLFRPEDGTDFVVEALVRLWREGTIFVAASEADPSKLAAVPRAPIDQRPSASPDRRPRVVYVVNGTDVRGGIRIVFEHCNRLRDRGIETMIVSYDDPVQTWFPNLRAPLIAGRDFPPSDVAVATYWTTAEIVSQLNCSRFYFIQHDESLFERDEEWKQAVRKTYRLPLEFVTISSWLVDLIRDESGKTATLVPNGTNSDMFFPEPAYPRGDKVRVMVEGNSEIFWKGMEEAKQVLDGLDVEVWTLGNTGIEGDRNFVNPSQDDVRRMYSSCDILLKTSWYEGMPLPHMEAMACGCALVTTNVPGVRDYCIDGWNCLMAEPRNVPQIRSTLERVIEDRALRETLIANGLKTAREHFGWDDKMDLLAKVYAEAAAAARTRSAQAQVQRRPAGGFGRRRLAG